MPNKHNAKCRHHIPKMKYTVRNWAEYDAALRARGSLTLWVTAEAMDHWTALLRSTPGGQCFCSDLAIEASLLLRLVCPSMRATGLPAMFACVQRFHHCRASLPAGCLKWPFCPVPCVGEARSVDNLHRAPWGNHCW